MALTDVGSITTAETVYTNRVSKLRDQICAYVSSACFTVKKEKTGHTRGGGGAVNLSRKDTSENV